VSRPHVIVIGASSGGVAALLQIAAALPKDLPAVVGVVLHAGNQPSILPDLLSARGPLPAVHPAHGQALRPGTVYVAPPDRHMLFTADAVRLSRGPRENHARPAIDPLFRSAALHWRERAVGVVLTGDLDDGSAGLRAIKECGGTAVVQDPADAVEASMLASVEVDHCLPLAGIVGHEPATPAGPVSAGVAREQAIFEGRQVMENLDTVGRQSPLTCPECGGSLWELKDERPLRYRCHTGHAYSARSLEFAQTETAEHSLWSSVRALKEREMLLRRLADVAQATGDSAQAEAGRLQADRVRAQAEQLARLSGRDEPNRT